MKPVFRLGLVLLAALAPPLAAQDVARGARLFNETALASGRKVASCAGCHANVTALRALVANRGGRPEDVRFMTQWLDAVFSGAQPGAKGAKGQYRGVLSQQDIADLAAYISAAQTTALQPAFAWLGPVRE